MVKELLRTQGTEGAVTEVVGSVRYSYDAEPMELSPRVKEQTMTPKSTPRLTALRLTLLAALIVIFNVATQASPIQYQYGGVITQADSSTGVAPGAPFSGTFSYDPANLSSGLGFEGFSQANYGLSTTSPGSVPGDSGLALQIGGQTILANPGGVAIVTSESDTPGQYGKVDASGNPVSPYTTVVISNSQVDTSPLQVSVNLTNPTRGLSDSLYPLNIAEFPEAQLDVTLSTNPGAAPLYTGTINSLVELTVPEPVFATVLCIVSIGWFARVRRRLSVVS